MDSFDVVIPGNKASACFNSLQLSSSWAVTEILSTDIPTYSTDPKTLVIFIDDNINQASLAKDLDKAHELGKYPIKFCVFCIPPNSIDGKLAQRFDDFIFFPCTPSEFNLRLGLLQGELAPPSIINCQSILEEFASLNLRGYSETFARTLALIKQTAKCDASVLIEGETGTGKENAARAIHYIGKRQDNAFVPINCGAIPDNLLESELFGHEKGAFTDARQKQQGLVALANNGTLFLDEVDSLSPKAQAALLRFLQTGEYRPLGGGAASQSNVRVIAATNANLAECVQRKEFREDLYFRLNVLYVRMPPLRERPEDISVIAEHLIKKYLAEYGSGPTRIHSAALRELQSRQWPGNVRELENVLLREFLLSSGDQIMMERKTDTVMRSESHSTNVSAGITGPVSFQEAKEAAISQFECGYLHALLAMTEGNVTEAARIAGKERRCLGKLIKKYKIDKSKFAGQSISA